MREISTLRHDEEGVELFQSSGSWLVTSVGSTRTRCLYNCYTSVLTSIMSHHAVGERWHGYGASSTKLCTDVAKHYLLLIVTTVTDVVIYADY